MVLSCGDSALSMQISTKKDGHTLRVKRWMTIDTKAINTLDIDKIDAGDNRPEYCQIRY